jgi:hypothetical protein
MKKYEVKILMHKEYIENKEHANKKLQEAQNEGWQIAGDILVKNESGHCRDNYLHIPLKRRIKTKSFNKILSIIALIGIIINTIFVNKWWVYLLSILQILVLIRITILSGKYKINK